MLIFYINPMILLLNSANSTIQRYLLLHWHFPRLSRLFSGEVQELKILTTSLSESCDLEEKLENQLTLSIWTWIRWDRWSRKRHDALYVCFSTSSVKSSLRSPEFIFLLGNYSPLLHHPWLARVDNLGVDPRLTLSPFRWTNGGSSDIRQWVSNQMRKCTSFDYRRTISTSRPCFNLAIQRHVNQSSPPSGMNSSAMESQPHPWAIFDILGRLRTMRTPADMTLADH